LYIGVSIWNRKKVSRRGGTDEPRLKLSHWSGLLMRGGVTVAKGS
jgi:hypothetical protein